MDQEQQNQTFNPTYGSISFMTGKSKRIPPRVKILELIDTKFVPQTNNNPTQILLQCKVTDGDQNGEQAEFHFISEDEWDKERVQQYQPIVEIDDFRKFDRYIIVGRYRVLNNENDIIKKEVQITTSQQEMLTILEVKNRTENNGEDEHVSTQGMVMKINTLIDKSQQEYYQLEVQDGTAKIIILILHYSKAQGEKIEIHKEYKFIDLLLQKKRGTIRIDNGTTITLAVISRMKFLKRNEIEQSLNHNAINVIGWVCRCSKIGRNNFKSVRLLTITDQNKEQTQIIISDPDLVQNIHLQNEQLVALLGLNKEPSFDITGELQLELSPKSLLRLNNQINSTWIPPRPQFLAQDWEINYWQRKRSTVEQINQELSQNNSRRKLFHIVLTFNHLTTGLQQITQENFRPCFTEFKDQNFTPFDETVINTILGQPIQNFLNQNNENRKKILIPMRDTAKFDVIFVGWYAEWNNQSRLMFEILDIRPQNVDHQDVTIIQDQIIKKIKQ